jgi:hypothetical protein
MAVTGQFAVAANTLATSLGFGGHMQWAEAMP